MLQPGVCILYQPARRPCCTGHTAAGTLPHSCKVAFVAATLCCCVIQGEWARLKLDSNQPRLPSCVNPILSLAVVQARLSFPSPRIRRSDRESSQEVSVALPYWFTHLFVSCKHYVPVTGSAVLTSHPLRHGAAEGANPELGRCCY